MTDIPGFSAKATRFFEDLEDNNTREFWTAHKDVFDREVSQPLAALLESLPDRYQPFRILRMHRDLRFSKDKSPYKTQQGAMHEGGGGGHYLHIAADGLLVAAGTYQMEADQLERYRAAVDDNRSGKTLERVLAELSKASIEVLTDDPPPLKTAPRGYPKEHPRIDLLRQKGLIAHRSLAGSGLRRQDTLREFVVETYDACEPLLRWLGKHVGPTSQHRGPSR
jgi:uncharacterized protein (TIGR02453 family)